jgi:sulfatase maturation enzyme AslB (radical SAM superfamily)
MLIVKRSDNTIKISNTGVIKTKFNNFKGWYCSSGLTYISVDLNGLIFGNVCIQGGSYGNVYDEYVIPTTPIICKSSSCFCAADINIPKAKTIDYLNELLSIKYSPKQLSTFTPSSDVSDIVAMMSSRNLVSQDTFSLDWFLGKRCNFNCSYCPSTVHDNYSPHLELEKFIPAFDNLYDLIRHHKLVEITFTGGEPTLNPNYLDIVKHVLKDNTRVITITNGTAHIDKLIYLLQSGGLTISIHQEYSQIDKILEKIHILYEYIRITNKLTVNYMIRPGTADKCRKFLDRLPPKKPNFFITIDPLMDNHNVKDHKTFDYDQEELSLIHSNF